MFLVTGMVQMAKYKFECNDEEILRKICNEVEIYGNLDEVLKEINIFLKSLTYQSYSLISIRNKEEENAVNEFLKNYRND